jgi:hypothetical protein
MTDKTENYFNQCLDISTEADLGFTEDLTESNIIFPTCYEDWGIESEECSLAEIFGDSAKAVEYQGRKVTLNKPFRTPGGPKKSAVYVKNESGKVVIVRFGDPNMSIKKNNPERRKSFRARHNCDNPGPKWKARYWSCRAW